MSIKSPYASQIGKGAYSVIVFKDGDLIIAEDAVGTIIKENANADTVIQAAINNNNGAGKVVLNGLFDTTSELTFPTASWTTMLKGVVLQGYGVSSGINYTPSTGYAIKLVGTAGNEQCASHNLDNLLLKAPNTTNGVIGMLGGVTNVHLSNLKINDCPNGKGIYLKYDATYANNQVNISDFVIYKCKYGIYAEGGPSLLLSGRGYIKTFPSTSGLEALYYTVTGYTGDGWKQLYTENLEIATEAAAQRSMYVKGDPYFFSQHNNLYDDMGKPIYLDGGRHAFHGGYLGNMDWSIGTQVTIDQASRLCLIDGKDPMFGLAELQTPFHIDSNSSFVTCTGTKDVTDTNAASGKCIELDAYDEQVAIWYSLGIGMGRMNKYLSRGKYLLTIHARDSNQVANDLKVNIQASEGGVHDINIKYYTLLSTYNAFPYSFTLADGDVGDNIIIYLRKATSSANTISVDYLTLQQVGTDYHQSLGGGLQFLYMPDAGTLPAASASFRGVIAFQPGGSSVADTMKMCIKSAADTYSWVTVVTG